MGQSLARSVEQYNKFVGTLESRVLVTARRMHELHLTTERPPTLEPLEAAPRSLSATELTEDLGRSARDEAFLERTTGHAASHGDGVPTGGPAGGDPTRTGEGGEEQSA
jgi:DNA recombination protein RmuC